MDRSVEPFPTPAYSSSQITAWGFSRSKLEIIGVGRGIERHDQGLSAVTLETLTRRSRYRLPQTMMKIKVQNDRSIYAFCEVRC